MLRRAAFTLFTSTAAFAAAEPELGLTPEMLHGILREAAAKIEARYGSERPEAEQLVERIEAILTSEPPPLREGDRAQAIARSIHLINVDASAKANLGGYRGYRFDGSLTGHLQTYHDLEKLDTHDADEVLRWLEMHRAPRNSIGMTRPRSASSVPSVPLVPSSLASQKTPPRRCCSPAPSIGRTKAAPRRSPR